MKNQKINKNKDKIIQTLWVLILITIPLFSIFGRTIQRWVNEKLSSDQLAILLGLVLLIICIKAIYCIIKNHDYRRIWHLAWFVPLFLVAPYFMPIIEERVHFIIFGSFGFLSRYIFVLKTAVILCLSFSMLDEVLQWYLRDRVGDWFDVGINTLASVAGAIFANISKKNNA